MELKLRYELYLNHISALEYYRRRESFEDYAKDVLDFLKANDLFVFEDDLMEKLKNDQQVKNVHGNEPLTMQHIQTAIPNTFLHLGESRKKNEEDKEPTRIWYRIWGDETIYIVPEHELYYDLFFIYKLRGLDLMEMDNFLSYQLELWYDKDLDTFSRFLQLAVRKHGQKLQPEMIQTINEWINQTAKKITSDVSGNGATEKLKQGVKRSNGDNLTVLTQDQTALLIYMLARHRVILPLTTHQDGISKPKAALSFSALTGYNPDNIRQNLSKEELQRIASNEKNLDAIIASLSKITGQLTEEKARLKKPKSTP